MKIVNYTALALCLSTSPAIASDFFFKPYVGADYNYVHASYKSGGSSVANENLHGLDGHVGARIHKYFGVEGSYLWTADANKSHVLGTGINTSVNVRGFAFDAMGYLPLSEKVELIGTAGVSRYRAHLGLGGLVADAGSESETKGRVGAGAQYWLTNNLNMRGIVRYQGADFDGALNNAVIASLGFNWQF